MRQLIAGCFAVLVVGCSSMPHLKINGLDGLKVIKIELDPISVAVKCNTLMERPFLALALTQPLACANINFKTWTCEIYFSKFLEGITMEHELLHCDGYSHDDGEMQSAFDKWRNENAERK